MQLNSLKAKSKRVTSHRVGRGGKRGKTSGHGGKGQTARAGHKIRPEMRDIIKKLPKRRGHGKNRARTVRPQAPVAVVNLAVLANAFKAGDTVTPATLVKKGIVKKGYRVKILGAGELSAALSVSGVSVSSSARAAIEKAGGSVVAYA
ncbi:MAG TPA: 50S ribosomal protein L15 [Candidatus Paceibacterota bacterium]|nr:50S ribosomal protein L15 [Candidatus Paceibacterota bacterium]